MMALPCLPAGEIVEAFQHLTGKLSTPCDPRLADLANYFASTWVNSQLWPPQTWSVYKETVRTNNDVEGNYNLLI